MKSAETSIAMGVIMRTCEELLYAEAVLKKSMVQTSYSCQYVEIYDEKVTDLLTGQDVKIRRDSGDLIGASEVSFSTIEEAHEILKNGHTNKKFATTTMNNRSSRSHTAFIINIHKNVYRCPADGCSSDSWVFKSELHLVDLAGSERLKKSKVEGENLKEAVNINSSLLALGKVITALADGRHHVPYFESKLTMLLKRAFGGNSRTVALVHSRSEDEFGDETLQSLRFGERCAQITNKLRAAASSLDTAIASIDDALSSTFAQLVVLEKSGKTYMKQYASLKAAYRDLTKRRQGLVA